MNVKHLAGIAFGLVLGLNSCNSVNPNPTPVINSVGVSPSNLELLVGGNQTLSANVQGTGSFDNSVTWSSADNTVAVVDQNGKVSALKVGVVKIRATSKANIQKFGEASLTVKANPATVFNIKVVFPNPGNLTATQKQAFQEAANRWAQVITGDLPDIVNAKTQDGRILNVDDVEITADAPTLDGPGGLLGQAGPEYLRLSSNLPITGIMEFDKADMATMETNGTLKSVILHEMGHVLGIGTLWDDSIQHNGNPDCQSASVVSYGGTQGKVQYQALGKSGNVPVENEFGPGTKCGHWKESTFKSELMTGFAEKSGSMPLSKLTLGALQDLGYVVNLSAADAYVIPPVASQGTQPQGMELQEGPAPEQKVVPGT